MCVKCCHVAAVFAVHAVEYTAVTGHSFQARAPAGGSLGTCPGCLVTDLWPQIIALRHFNQEHTALSVCSPPLRLVLDVL